ncbi:MAG: 5-(carboxyamino)imidazole ribonucleotide synthase [Nitrospira sp.]|nr:5-(carboxyamino)imidazole ribonucleotide synthase [Nitrospira sp.]MDH4304384.1 5-(carboxyamino)imidazole ribonucleotide synthase [Nitrospira sp.]MDH5193711.1 5-(carboxyamino)imidazole ribonucleotide synthase [Nitrospira sp.]
MQSIVEPGSVVGVLGGGQLGAMFAGVARRMGYRVAVWDPDHDAPAHRIADQSFSTPFTDHDTRERFVDMVKAMTLEWENIPAELCEWLEQRRPLHPSSAVLRVIQDRLTQKQFLASCSLPVADFAEVQSGHQLHHVISRLGLPLICKTARSGYDGKGQWLVRQPSDVAQLERVLTTSSETRWIAEQFIAFVRELSVIVVRSVSGDTRVYPVVENRHEQGILCNSRVPASISSGDAEAARELSVRAVTALQGIGVFCVEMFQTQDGHLLINEIAPRPHNSGHYTLDVCTVSQFEQQVRVTCGLPLGEVRLLSSAVMVNLLGDEVTAVMSAEGSRETFSTPGASVHLYGKRVIRPGRKMGHVTFTASDGETAVASAQQFMSRVKIPPSVIPSHS